MSESPEIAWGDGSFGMAWLDGRDGNKEIYFARLDRVGARVGGEERLSRDGADSVRPDVAWSGSEFLVVWQEERHGAPEIYAARIAGDGRVVARDARLTDDDAFSRYPTVLWTGDRWLVAWSDYRADANYEVFYTLLDAVGARTIVDRRATRAGGDSVGPVIARAGGSVGVIFNDLRDRNWEIYFTRIGCVP